MTHEEAVKVAEDMSRGDWRIKKVGQALAYVLETIASNSVTVGSRKEAKCHTTEGSPTS